MIDDNTAIREQLQARQLQDAQRTGVAVMMTGPLAIWAGICWRLDLGPLDVLGALPLIIGLMIPPPLCCNANQFDA